MAALVAEHVDHQIGGAVHHLRSVGKAGRRIDEAAQPHDPGHLVELAEHRLDLRQQIDGAGARRLLAVLDRNAAAELTFGDQFALRAETQLTGHHQQVAAAHAGHIIGDRAGRARQRDAESRERFFSHSGHEFLLDPLSFLWPIGRWYASALSHWLPETLPASILPLSCSSLLANTA